MITKNIRINEVTYSQHEVQIRKSKEQRPNMEQQRKRSPPRIRTKTGGERKEQGT